MGNMYIGHVSNSLYILTREIKTERGTTYAQEFKSLGA